MSYQDIATVSVCVATYGMAAPLSMAAVTGSASGIGNACIPDQPRLLSSNIDSVLSSQNQKLPTNGADDFSHVLYEIQMFLISSWLLADSIRFDNGLNSNQLFYHEANEVHIRNLLELFGVRPSKNPILISNFLKPGNAIDVKLDPQDDKNLMGFYSSHFPNDGKCANGLEALYHLISKTVDHPTTDREKNVKELIEHIYSCRIYQKMSESIRSFLTSMKNGDSNDSYDGTSGYSKRIQETYGPQIDECLDFINAKNDDLLKRFNF